MAEGVPPLSAALEKAATTMFQKMDIDGDGKVNHEEAVKFWGKNFAKVNAKALFNEVCLACRAQGQTA